jgi:hypothetical protein
LGEVEEGFDGLLHVLQADPLAGTVDFVHAAKEVGRRQTAGGEVGTVGAAADGF